MPVELPEITAGQRRPSPPKAIVWLGVFVIVMLANIVWILVTWPKDEPTMSVWFWMRLLVFPAIGWSVAFGLRLFYYEEEMTRLAAKKETRERDRAEATEFAQEPLAVLGLSFLTAMNAGGDGVASAIAQKKRALESCMPRSGEDAVRHTALALNDDEGTLERYLSLFLQLTGQIKETLDTLPADVPFSIRLQVPEDPERAHVLKTWETCWQQCGYRDAPTSLLDPQQGLMALDGWLDVKGGTTLEKFTLYVAAQLHDEPPENSAEAGVALLLGWAPLAERRGLKPIALLHRPVQSETTDFRTSLPKALLWGRTSSMRVSDVWQAGLTGGDKSAFLKDSADLGLKASKTEDFAGIQDIDRALGNPGAAAAWLSVVLAIERAWRTTEPQLVLARETNLRLAVVQPIADEHDMEVINEGT
ncbi:hypothetical protein [Caballeronia sordidicola]|uniref:Uncharacterized protein n=1 Tax=Caballeronia sordidicola TaxID=196367 RepID=A0A226WMY8_CABSO|nr:hypothetical protein [Caballeronia sordidicola]OXC72190.1 hypothetical protein BSU04_43205 [Caballeronia sordidicola]